MTISEIEHYHRPATIEAALALLRAGGERAAPLAGGTDLVGTPPRRITTVVDLVDLGLDQVTTGEDGALLLGATVTLETLVSHPDVRAYADGQIAAAARYAAGSLVRNRATLGGTLIARAGECDLPVLLVALDAHLVIQGQTRRTIPLSPYYQRGDRLAPGELITEIHLPPLEATTRVALERIARSPMDRPLLTVAARRDADAIRIAAGAFGPPPQLVDPAEPAAGLDLRDDHLASAAYRQAMVEVLVQRLME